MYMILKLCYNLKSKVMIKYSTMLKKSAFANICICYATQIGSPLHIFIFLHKITVTSDFRIFCRITFFVYRDLNLKALHQY